MFELRIEVTQDDIDRGIACDCYLCPIALALGRAADAHFPNSSVGVSANNTHLNIRTGMDKRFMAFTPAEASKFMRDFDELGEDAVEPFSFRAQFN